MSGVLKIKKRQNQSLMEQTNEQTIFEKLKIALGLVENLKQENSVYKDNFSHLKIQYDSINAKYSELSREFGILSTEKNESNQQSTLVIANLKSLIDEKTIEAENYRSQIQSPKYVYINMQRFGYHPIINLG